MHAITRAILKLSYMPRHLRRAVPDVQPELSPKRLRNVSEVWNLQGRSARSPKPFGLSWSEFNLIATPIENLKEAHHLT